MTILEIQIKNYKSLAEWQKVEWGSNLMIFVGKNGSGKTSILEAVAMIFEANSNAHFYNDGRVAFDYKIVLRLSKAELAEIDTRLEYIPENYIVEAYCQNGEYNLKVNRVKSKSLVAAIRRQEGDLREMARTLSGKFDDLSKHIDTLCSADTDGIPLFCIEVTALNNSTNYGHRIAWIKQTIDYKIQECQRLLKEVIADDESFQFNHVYNPFQNINPDKDFAFELTYVAPRLTRFEKDYIHIDEPKIIAEVERINKALTQDRVEISDLVNRINALLTKIGGLVEREENRVQNAQDKHFAIIRNIQRKISRRCFFLKNDNGRLLFNDARHQVYDSGYGRSNINERLILESYIKTYEKDGNKQKELLQSLYENKLEIKDKKALCDALETFINNDIPSFDRGMYTAVKAQIADSGQVSLCLIEQGGKEVPFELTSTGRRWYFTYYFIKKCVKSGDILIIDEPAAFLHPQVQTEILRELEQISKRCSVMISTHSPYMISDKIDDYYYVRMTAGGTKIERQSIKEFVDAKNELGLVSFNSFILGREKHYILVEGKHDAAAISAFMRVFNIEQSQYDYRAFVGQEIDLPTPSIGNELYVFDGWLYDDTLITNGKFTPSVSGTLYIWQQVTQRYTYLNFDSNGGDYVERIVAEIGVPIVLPMTVKDGWAFGGWEYGGNVYSGVYTPTTASPSFIAVWNYSETTITLYDGNVYGTITAHAGDKVLLPFPTRTGYAFFGWYQDGDGETAKVYYGQITKLANVVSIRLDALWIRNNEINLDDLANGTSGKTRVHFVDETLDPSNMQGYAGAVLDTPNPTRAGFTLVGWVWKTTATTGKIYTGGTMIVPENAGGKILLEAVWTARPAGAQAQDSAAGAGTMSNGDVGGSFSGSNLSNKAEQSILFGGLTLCIAALFFMSFNKRKRFGLFGANGLSVNAVSVGENNGNAMFARNAEEVAATDNTVARIRPIAAKINGSKASPFSATIKKLGLISTVIAFALVAVLAFETALSKFDGNALRALAANDGQVSRTQTKEEEVENPFVFDLTEYGETDDAVANSELLSEFESRLSASTFTTADNDLSLSDEEAFLYALIMLDLYGLGYDVFPAKAVLEDEREILGLAYTDYAEAYGNEDEADETVYFGAGFVSLPGQAEIAEEDIENGVYIVDSAVDESNAETEASGYGYILSFTENYGPCHYVADGKYVVYSVDGTDVQYVSVEASEEAYNSEYGAVYSYDEGRNVYDPDLGKEFEFTATSINTLLDPQIAKGEYERYVAEQTANGFTVDTMNFVYISYSALDAYYLSQQDESLLGIDVEEFYAMERTIGPNEYYTVDEYGNLTKLNFPPPPTDESKASWLDRLAGAALAIGTICVGVIIVAAVSVVSCGAATAAAPYIMGAFIGAGMEIFMQTVIQGKKIEDINWLRVGIAAVSGVLCAIPGVGWLGAGLIQGGMEAAMTWAEGGSIEDILKAFTVGFITGVVIHGAGKALSKIKFCFVAGTGILMAGGYTKAIENIRVGDYVKSYDEATGQVENKRVTQTFVNETYELTTIKTSDGQEIVSTPGHKYFANGSWISAEDLRAGDILVNVNGQKVVVESVQHELLESPVKIYNFEVEDNHTYFVGNCDGIVVHNAACSKVYSAIDAKTGKPYIGRTTRNVNVRVGEHAKNAVNPRVLENVTVIDDLTYEQARGLEQILIDNAGGVDFLSNTINGIGKNNPNKGKYIKAALEYLFKRG